MSKTRAQQTWDYINKSRPKSIPTETGLQRSAELSRKEWNRKAAPEVGGPCKHVWVGQEDDQMHCDLCGVFADCEGCNKPGCPCSYEPATEGES
jgi:hypothetical protein